MDTTPSPEPVTETPAEVAAPAEAKADELVSAAENFTPLPQPEPVVPPSPVEEAELLAAEAIGADPVDPLHQDKQVRALIDAEIQRLRALASLPGLLTISHLANGVFNK